VAVGETVSSRRLRRPAGATASAPAPAAARVAVTCSAVPFTVSMPVSDVPLAVPVKLTDCCVPLGSVKVVE